MPLGTASTGHGENSVERRRHVAGELPVVRPAVLEQLPDVAVARRDARDRPRRADQRVVGLEQLADRHPQLACSLSRPSQERAGFGDQRARLVRPRHRVVVDQVGRRVADAPRSRRRRSPRSGAAPRPSAARASTGSRPRRRSRPPPRAPAAAARVFAATSSSTSHAPRSTDRAIRMPSMPSQLRGDLELRPQTTSCRAGAGPASTFSNSAHVGDRARHRPVVAIAIQVERRVGRHAPVRRLEPDDPVDRGRDPDRPADVRAAREQSTCRSRARRPTRRWTRRPRPRGSTGCA